MIYKKEFKFSRTWLGRTIQFVTGFNRIHHIYYSYGYKLPFLQVGYFRGEKHFVRHGFKRLKNQYHNCTKSGVY